MPLGVYGMEIVECVGTLAINVKNVGESFASIMLAGNQMKSNVESTAEILLSFLKRKGSIHLREVRAFNYYTEQSDTGRKQELKRKYTLGI